MRCCGCLATAAVLSTFSFVKLRKLFFFVVARDIIFSLSLSRVFLICRGSYQFFDDALQMYSADDKVAVDDNNKTKGTVRRRRRPP